MAHEIGEPIADFTLPRAPEGYAGIAAVNVLDWHLTITRASEGNAVRVVVRPVIHDWERIPWLNGSL